jgi:hypothetical protein
VSSTPHASPSTVASPFFCPVGLGQKEKDGKKERRVPVIDNGLLRARGEHNTPFHRAISHCLSADELPRLTRPRRPLLACIIKPVITPVRRAVCITLFCTSKVLDVVSPLPASLQSAECSTVLFANAVLRGPAKSTALQSRCVSSHQTLDSLPFVYGTLAWRIWVVNGGRGFGWVSAHPPACTDGIAPAYEGLLLTKSDPFEQYMK